MDLTRQQILKGNYEIPTQLVDLVPSKHLQQRLEERGMNLSMLPKKAQVTWTNIHSARCFDGKLLVSAVIRIPYTYAHDMYIAFNPYDGGVKTAWLRNAKFIKERRKLEGIRQRAESKTSRLHYRKAI
jgi:hypothetical protein